MSIGDRIRDVRKERGLSQQRLADRAGVTLSLVSKIEQGVITDPHYSTLSGVAHALGMTVGELLEAPPALSGKASAPPETRAQEVEERRQQTRVPTKGELEGEIARLKDINETRRRQLIEYSEEGGPRPDRTWLGDVEARERQLTKEYEERGILPFIEEVSPGGSVMLDYDTRLASVRLYRELMLMRSYVDEARVLVMNSLSNMHYQGVKLRSAMDASNLEDPQVHREGRE